MRVQRTLGFLLGMLLLVSLSVQAAVIHGTVYNIELNSVRNARVEIDTQPKQVFVATNGTYSFNVPPGDYLLTAKLVKNGTITAFAAEQLTVASEGDYVLDLIVFPEFDDASDILNATDQINPEEAGLEQDSTPPYLAGAAVLLVLALIGWYLWKRQARTAPPHAHPQHPPVEHVHHENVAQEVAPLPATERDDAKDIVEFIKKEGGRTTQKDIRKHSPLSEAKISLIIADLEHKGIIEKIKKGRGNIIVLK